MTILIYALRDPRTGEVRYIGRTKKTLPQRLAGHMYTRGIKPTHKVNWINQLKALGISPSIEEIERCNEITWREAERRHIDKYRSLGAKLTNGTPGGDGRDSITPEILEKIRIANTGKTRSLETRQRMRAAKIGKPLSSSHKIAIGAAHKGRVKGLDDLIRRTRTRKAGFSQKLARLTPIIVNLYRHNFSQNMICRMVHVAKSTVRSILSASGETVRNSKEAIALHFRPSSSVSI